jgi:hypothetical protein
MARMSVYAALGVRRVVGACIARGEGAVMEALPHADAVVLIQRGHEYKYARCATLAGARVEWADDIAAAIATGPAAILHPAHLDERLVDGPVNAVLVRGRRASELEAALAAGDPSVRTMVDGDAIVLCTEALTAGELDEIAGALTTAWQRLDDG